MPNTPESLHCNIDGLKCLNEYYEELTVVIAPWSTGKKGVVCDCLPSCTEIDISVVYDARDKLDGKLARKETAFSCLCFPMVFSIFGSSQPISKVQIGLAALPTERYKRNVIRGKLDLVGKQFCLLFVAAKNAKKTKRFVSSLRHFH